MLIFQWFRVDYDWIKNVMKEHLFEGNCPKLSSC